MSKVRMTIAALVGAAALASPAAATTITGPGQSGWLTKVNSPSGSVTFTDTLAATGSGSVNLTTGSDGDLNAELRLTAYNGLLLSDLDALSYETYGTAWNGQQLPYIALMVDTNNDGAADDQLQFEPGFQTVTSGNPSLPDQGAAGLLGWQSWDARAGGWYGMDTTNFNLSFASPGTGVQSLDDYIALNPSAKLATDPEGALRIQVGWASNTDVFDANVDDVIVDWGTVDAYDFERATGNTTQTVGPNGGSVSTDDDADGATLADPVEAAVTTSGAGTVSISKNAGTGAASGFSLVGQHLTITAPAQSASDPLIFTFRVQLPSPYPEGEVDVFRNGTKVLDCTDPTPGADADPDPCVESRATAGDDAEIVVRSSAASDWAIELPKPVVVLDTVPADPTNDTTPNYAFHTVVDGTTVAATVQCSITGVAASACNAGTYAPSISGQGAKTASFVPTFAGITGSATTDSFVLDTIPPTMNITLMTPHGHDTHATNITTPSFHFTSSENAMFECKVDAGAYAPCDSPGLGTSGDHVVAAQPEGLHTLTVRGTDPATNQGTKSFVFGVDLTDPDPEATVNDGDEFSMHENHALTCTDPPGVGGYFSGIYTCVANIDGVPRFDIPTHSDDLGYHQFTVTATDESGRVKTTGTAHYVVNAGPYRNVVNGFGPLGFWRLNNSQGSSTMSDASGNSRTGAYKNGVGLPRTGPAVDTTTNSDARAAEFTGKNAYGYVNQIYAPQTAYTMDAWIKPSSTQAMSILSHGAGAGEIYIDGSAHIAFRHVDTTITDATTTLNAGDWYHVQAVWSRPLPINPGTMTLRVERLSPGTLATISKNTTTGSSSRNASGQSTFYVGFGEQAGAQAFRGLMAEVAYFGSALSDHQFTDLTEAMRWVRKPIRAGANFAKPSVTISHPLDGDGYQSFKAPSSGAIDFACTDPADDGNEPFSCSAALDGNPVNDGDPLPSTAGSHTLTVTADDGAGDPVVRSVTFLIGTYSDVINQDAPTAYWRLNEPTGATAMGDQTGNHPGEYKWDLKDPLSLVNGGTGISGDSDTTREWLGRGAYAYVNGLGAPADASSVEAWVKLDDPARDQMILQHGGGSTLYVAGSAFVYRPNGNVGVKVSGGSPSSSAFRHVVGTWDGAVARLYVDGSLIGSVDAATPPPSGAATFYVGRGDIGLPDLHGTLDEVAYFPTALSDRRVLLHFWADPPAGHAPGKHSFGAASSSSKAKAKARTKVRAATKALAKAKAKVRALKRNHAGRRALKKAQKAVAARSAALKRARRALARI